MRALSRLAASFAFLFACDAAAPELPADMGAVDAAPADPACGLATPPRGLCLLGQADGEECNDGDPCSVGDVCTGGICAGAMQRLCVRCKVDADCCAGPGSVVCDESRPSMWAPTGTCAPSGTCQLAETTCRAGVACEPGKGC